jgi:DNA-directed RNA polymerase specialized sigma24 family protein
VSNGSVEVSRRCRDDAEEIASQVLLKLSCGPALASFEQGRARFRSWLQKVVHRAALDFRRHEQKIPGGGGRGDKEDPLDALLDPASLDDLTDDLDQRLAHDLGEADAAAQRVRARVKPSSWEAYYRTAIAEETALEVAEALGISITAVYQAKHRVQAMLEAEGRDVLS